MSNQKPKPAVPTIAQLDQASKAVTSITVPYWAAVFRAFCAEEDITRLEALSLTMGLFASERRAAPPKSDD